MKIIYSELKKLLPNLTDNYQQLRDDLTLIGHFAAGHEIIDGEHVYDLEVRQNRGDCQSYYGIALDLSVFYNIPFVIPTYQPNISSEIQKNILPIQIKTTDANRVMAIILNNINVQDSPDWLKKFLTLHDINPRNNIVDITNYIMLLFGIPAHAFDTAKSTTALIWENNQQYPEFTTLDGTTVKIKPETLLISDGQKPLSLSFIGGKNSGIESSTNSILIEIAHYNRVRVRRDSRDLKITTEAGTRLDKDLDANQIPTAFNYLIKLIEEFGHGQVNSQLFDYYPTPINPEPISFDPKKPALFAGINISPEYSLDCLTRLGCKIEKTSPLYQGEMSRSCGTEGFLVTPPSIRKDITQEEDLVEEVIRFYGYNKIPLNEPIDAKNPGDITPPILYLIDTLKDKLVVHGYDEVLSWPLVQKSINDSLAIYTQNSINSEFPVLRQSIIQSLENQFDQYNRYKLFDQKFFEFGKIFIKLNNQFTEQHSLGISDYSRQDLINTINQVFDISNGQNYIVKNIGNQYFAEIILDDLNKPTAYIPSNQKNFAYELTSQIITLDANINLDSHQDEIELIKNYSSQIDSSILWQMQITDVYQDTKINKWRYTFRVSYYNTDDKTAKQIHLKTFNLT